jgi:hypothetical protein
MRLSPSEKQTLLGPLVVGCLLGAFVAYAVTAFASEYRLQGIDPSPWQVAAEAAVGFLVSVGGTVGVLGLLPIAIGRLRSKREGDA